mmetsp:Transcript_10037/g.39062  ORF Transcript_10037/g.39062 Transcript_10037/m.39062 type:complete len:271 (-) Transcript_10037:68-880(-)
MGLKTPGNGPRERLSRLLEPLQRVVGSAHGLASVGKRFVEPALRQGDGFAPRAQGALRPLHESPRQLAGLPSGPVLLLAPVDLVGQQPLARALHGHVASLLGLPAARADSLAPRRDPSPRASIAFVVLLVSRRLAVAVSPRRPHAGAPEHGAARLGPSAPPLLHAAPQAAGGSGLLLLLGVEADPSDVGRVEQPVGHGAVVRLAGAGHVRSADHRPKHLDASRQAERLPVSLLVSAQPLRLDRPGDAQGCGHRSASIPGSYLSFVLASIT